MLRFARAGLLALTATFAATACAPVAQNTPQSIAAERQNSANLVRKLDSSGKLIKDRRLQRYLNGVVSRVASQRPRGSVPIRAFIVKDADVNAFTTGGGYVFFNAGMLAALENEAQLASVAAHEIAHIDRGHIQAQRSNRTAIGIGAALATIGAAAAGIDPNIVQGVVGLGANAAVANFSRGQETDADNTGIRYLVRAGYSATEGAKSFDVLRRVSAGRGGASFFASHPAPRDRKSNLLAQARSMGARSGRVGRANHDRATRRLRREVLQFYESRGRLREAAQIRRNLR